MYSLPTRTGYSLLLLILGSLSFSHTATALPSFTRQTGMACTACHTQSFGPNLTPYGRQFKLHGYVWGDNESLLSRLGGMVMGSMTNLKRNDPSIPANSDFSGRDFNANNNLALDQVSAFYGGRIYQQMGALMQFTYNGVSSSFKLDNSDIRIASENDWLGQNFVYGLSVNNNPTVQDLWNTTPAWGYPYAQSPFTPGVILGPEISSFGGAVGGASLYSLINDLIYIEAGAYTSLAKDMQRGLGYIDPRRIDGGAPYWRINLQKEWHGHYWSLGHFGFRANVQPDVTVSSPTDRYTDLGVDFNYQYLANPLHIYEFKASYIREQQELAATYNPAFDINNPSGASRYNQQLGFLALNTSYTYDQTYSLSVAFNHSYSNRDLGLYNNSPSFKPNSEYFTFEFDYIPFGKLASSGASSYKNLRFAAQYVAYTQLNGADKNYDGTGRSSSDNNTLYFNGWLIF